jgi:DNA-binding NarL/FixJ family response regulator
MPIRLVLADDHPYILDALEHFFGTATDFQVLVRCLNGEDALQALRQHRPDILILDIRMPGNDDLSVLRAIRKEKLPTRVVLLTGALDEEEVLEAIRLGVRGVVIKDMAPQLLLQCVRKVHAGGQWLERHSVTRALDRLLRREAGAREVAGVLTAREREIVRLVASGLRNKEIADKLSVTEGTVKLHLYNVFKKFHVGSRVELLRYAQDKGLI